MYVDSARRISEEPTELVSGYAEEWEYHGMSKVGVLTWYVLVTSYRWYRVAEIVRGIVYLNDPAVVDLVIDVSGKK